MKKGLLFAIVFIFVIVIVNCATSETKIPTNYQGPIAERPSFSKKDSWTYNNAYWEFLKEEDEHWVFLYGKKKDFLYTNFGFTPIKKIDKDSGKVLFEGSPSVFLVNFLLWVGKTWEYVYETMSQTMETMIPVDVLAKVVDFKELTVQAGTFKSFKIRHIWRVRNFPDNGTSIYWYAPAVKQIIKYDDLHPRELVKYKLKNNSPNM